MASHFFFSFFFFAHFYFPASGQAVVTDVVPSPPRFLPSVFSAHRVQQSHCSSVFHRVLLTHALALSASKFVHKKKSPRIDTSMHSAGLELTQLTCTRLEDNLIRHRGDRHYTYVTHISTCPHTLFTQVRRCITLSYSMSTATPTWLRFHLSTQIQPPPPPTLVSIYSHKTAVVYFCKWHFVTVKVLRDRRSGHSHK